MGVSQRHNFSILQWTEIVVILVTVLKHQLYQYHTVTQGKAQPGSRLQQVRVRLNAAAVSIEIKEATYLQKTLDTQRSPARHPCFHCQPLNEVWEGVDPGSTPSSHSGTLHAAELPWVGPAFPPGAQSPVQAVTQHFCYTFTLSYSQEEKYSAFRLTAFRICSIQKHHYARSNHYWNDTQTGIHFVYMQ